MELNAAHKAMVLETLREASTLEPELMLYVQRSVERAQSLFDLDHALWEYRALITFQEETEKHAKTTFRLHR